jgi:hypothetical protein
MNSRDPAIHLDGMKIKEIVLSLLELARYRHVSESTVAYIIPDGLPSRIGPYDLTGKIARQGISAIADKRIGQVKVAYGKTGPLKDPYVSSWDSLHGSSLWAVESGICCSNPTEYALG